MKLLKFFIASNSNRDSIEGEPVVTLLPVERPCSDENFEQYLELSKTQAYNGEITVEEIPDEVTEPTEMEQLRADVDYIAMETGEEL